MKAVLLGNSGGFNVFIIKRGKRNKTELPCILVRNKLIVREAVNKTIEINKIQTPKLA